MINHLTGQNLNSTGIKPDESVKAEVTEFPSKDPNTVLRWQENLSAFFDAKTASSKRLREALNSHEEQRRGKDAPKPDA